jgi:hypothetical protein
MDLTVREAATLLGCSARSVRARLARGSLPGRKKNACWTIPRDQLPLTETQRRKLQRKADAVRRAVDDVLPSRRAATEGQRGRSVVDLDSFRSLMAIRKEIVAEGSCALPPGLIARVDRDLSGALVRLAEAVLHYDCRDKLAAIAAVRRRLAHVLVLLLLADDGAADGPAFSWVHRLEQEALPAVAGFARWVERLERRP